LSEKDEESEGCLLTTEAKLEEVKNIIEKPGVNFINILRAAFAQTEPKSVKRQSSCQSFLRFQDLFVQKMLVECWRNLTQMSILSMFFEQLLHK